MVRTGWMIVAVAWLAAGCGGAELPSLPEAQSGEPRSVEWVGLSGLDDSPLDAQAMPAGSVGKVVFRILDEAAQPLSGATLTLSARSPDFADLLRFPDGDQCFSDEAGDCSIIIASQGAAGAVTLTARVAATLPVVAEFPLAVVPLAQDLQLKVTVEGVGSVTYTGEDADPLAALERTLLNADVDSGRLVSVELTDRFNNPVAGQAVELALLEQPSEQTDAGSAHASEDAGEPAVADTGSAADAALAVRDAAAGDAAAGDAAPSPDAAAPALDASVADAEQHADAGDSGDAGSPGDVGTPATSARVRVAVSVTGDCGATQAPSQPGAHSTNAQGQAHYCLFASGYRGDWRLYLRLPAAITQPLAPHQEAALALDGRTVAGEPVRLAARMSGDKVECNPGQETANIRFRVSNASGEGVPGVRVLFGVQGGLDGVSRLIGETNNQGDASVRGSCPRARVQGAGVTARVERPPLGPVVVPVEVRADAVDQIIIEADAENPQTVRDGDTLRYTVSAIDASRVQVLRPEGSEDPLQLQFGIASSGHANTLYLGDEAILAQRLSVDGDGLIALELAVRSRATMDRPIRLEARTLDGAVRAEQAITVSPGAASHLAIQPAGRVQALVGGVGGTVRVRVLDGDDVNTANGVPGARVQITAPPQLRLDRTVGVTDASGLFESVIVLVDRPGDHTLSVAASHAEWSAQSELVVEGTTGVPQAIQVRLNDQLLAPTGQDGEQPAHEVTLRAGEQLADVLSLRLTNAQGGGIPGLGLSIERIEGAEEACATWAEPGTTDDAGEVLYGQGLLALTGGPRVVRCVYRVRHGATPATTLVRVVQVPGRPLTATLERVGGLAPPLENRAGAPTDFSAQTAAQLELVARDDNGNLTSGQAMYVITNNCYVSARRLVLDEQGSARLFVTNAADSNAPCRVVAAYERALPGFEPPEQSLASAGFGAPALFNIANHSTSPSGVMLTRNGTHKWRLFGRNLIVDPNLTNNVPCADFSRCSSVQVVELGAANDQGVRAVRRVVHEGLPIAYDAELGDGTFTVEVPHAAMGAGGWLGLRLVANRVPGEPLRLGSYKPFYAQPRAGWVGLAPGGGRGQITVAAPTDNPNGAVELFGGQRVNLDDDEALELVVCGSDEVGKLFAVIDTVDGALPEQTVQSQRASRFGGAWLGSGGDRHYDRYLSRYQVDGQYPEMARPKDACILSDFNADGRLDLVVPGRTDSGDTSNGFPHVTIHHGVPGGFSEAQPVVWADPSVRNRQIKNMAASTAPPGVVVCVERLRANQFPPMYDVDSTHRACLERFFLPLEPQAGSWSPVVRSVDSLSANAPERQLLVVEPPRLVAMAQGGWIHQVGAWIGWDVRGVKRTLAALSSIDSLAYSPDGRLLAWSTRNVIGLTDTRTGRTQEDFLMAPGTVNDIAFSPDSQALVAGSNGGQAALFNVETGELARELPLQGHATRVAFSPDGAVVAAGNTLGHVVLWNAQTGELIVNNGTHRSDIEDIAFSPDGRWLATVSDDRTSRLFDAQTGAHRRVLLDGEDPGLTALAFSPDSQTVFILSNRMRYAVDVASTSRLNTASNASSHHSDFTISPSGRTLFAIGHQDRILAQANDFGVYTIRTSTFSGLSPHAVSPGSHNRVVMHPSGQSVAVAGEDGYLRYFALSEDPDRATLSIAYVRENGSDFIPLGGQAEPGSLWSDRAGFYRNRVALERPIVWRPYCGNGELDEGELFDNGQPWEPSTEYHISCGATCGDGFVHEGEGCDDGNNDAGDGCSRLCQVE